MRRPRSAAPTVRLQTVVTSVLLALTAAPAQAGTSGDLPWEAPLQRIADSLAGPVTTSVLILAIVVLGFALAFAEGAILRRVLGVVLGGTIAAAAASLVSSFFGTVSGAVFP